MTRPDDMTASPTGPATGASPAPEVSKPSDPAPGSSEDPWHDPTLYFNRELSQLDFNFRVLAQAQDPGARYPDPRGTWVRLINGGGPADDPFRASNAADCALAVLSTWHGEPGDRVRPSARRGTAAPGGRRSPWPG